MILTMRGRTGTNSERTARGIEKWNLLPKIGDGKQSRENSRYSMSLSGAAATSAGNIRRSTVSVKAAHPIETQSRTGTIPATLKKGSPINDS